MTREKRKCGNCSIPGHNVSTCTNPGTRNLRSVRAEAYSLENADDVRARTAAWKAANPQGYRLWLDENPEKGALYEGRKDPVRVRVNARTRYATSPQAKRARAAAWAKANPQACRRNALAREYGITPEQHAEILEFQDDVCPLCRECSPKATDHNHDTGQVRGILCFECNLLLGRLGDNARAVGTSCAALLTYLANTGDFVPDEIGEELFTLVAQANEVRKVLKS